MGTFINGESGSSVRTKINAAIEKTEGTSAISTIDVDGGAIDGVTIGTNSAVTDLRVDNLQLDGNTVSSTNLNGDITIDPNGTGDVNIGNFKFDADQTVGAGQDNYVLTYDNAGGKISLEAAAGGAGAALYAANEVSVTSQPSATGDDAIAIGDSAVASGANALAGPLSQASGTGSFAAAINSTSTSWGAKGTFGVALGFETRANTGTTGAVAIGYSADTRASFGVAIGDSAYVTANGTRAIAIGYQTEAAAAQSFAAGDGATIASTGTSAVALGTSYASGIDSFAAAIANNTSSYGATGANSIAIGYQAKATGQESLSFGSSNTVSVDYSGAYGRGNTISGGSGGTQFAFGAENSTSSTLAFAFGYKANAPTSKFAFANSRFSTNGDAQQGMVVLRSDTTDATAEALTVTNSSPDSNNQIILPNNSAFAFHGTIVARQKASGGTASAAWKIEGLIRREGTAATTTLVNSATTVLDNTPSWGMALSADTTNGGLKIEVTGAAATNIRWVATIHTSEVTYA